MKPLEFVRTLFRAGITGSLEHRTRLVNHHLEHILYDRIVELMRLIDGRVVYDVGAHRGEWSLRLASAHPGRLDIYLFEANDSLRGELARLGYHVEIAVLSDSEKEVDFYFSGRTGDSYFRENSVRYDHEHPTKVRTTTLNSLIAFKGLPLPDLIKIDVQGSEIDVLRGASRGLTSATLILIEIPLIAFNLSAPRVEEYFSFMSEQGFVPIELGEVHWMDGAVVQLDVLFCRKGLVSS